MSNRNADTAAADWVRRSLLLGLAGIAAGARAQGPSPQQTIERVKRSIVAVGTLQATRSPPFIFRGTGFAVGDGTLVATNAHVLPETEVTGASPEQLVVALPGAEGESRTPVRAAQRVAVDRDRDLALVRVSGPALPPLEVVDSGAVREGDHLLVTGFPLGTVLGVFPATHRASIAAIAPIVIPTGNARQLDAAKIRQLQSGAFTVFQLDATIHPGNSGSPLYDPATANVVGVINMAAIRRLKEGQDAPPSGISYAIPATHLLALLATVKR